MKDHSKIGKGEKFKYNDRAREAIRDMRKAQMPWDDIAEFFDISYHRLWKFTKADPDLFPSETPDAKTRKKLLSPDQISRVAELAEAGTPLVKIAEDIGWEPRTLQRRMLESDELVGFIGKTGTRPTELSERQLEELYNAAARQTKREHIASMLEVSPSWLNQQIRTPGTRVYDVYWRAQAVGIDAVEEARYKLALGGNIRAIEGFLATKDNQVAPTAQILEERRKEEDEGTTVTVNTYLKILEMSEEERREYLKQVNLRASRNEAYRKKEEKD